MLERNLGEQPIVAIMTQLELESGDLVSASEENITYKMVSRACKGRRLTPNIQAKICRALNLASKKSYTVTDLFTY